MTAKIRIIDLETGPEPSDASNGVIEFGYVDLVAQDRDLLGEPTNWYVGDGQGFLIDPIVPIPPDTSAIHNLIDADVRGKPKWNDVVPPLFDHNNPEHQVLAYAAHSAEHEKSLISTDLTGDKPWLCTYKIALRLWPESLSHSNGAVRYFLNPEGLDRERAQPTHRAFPDAYVSAFTLREALNLGHRVETLAKWSSEPALLPRCKIGDYRNGGKGTPWADVEGSFLHWMPSIIVPRKAVKEAISLARDAKDGEVRIDVSETKIRFTAGDTVLTSKLISGVYPDYSRVIPTSNNNIAYVDSKTLSAAADRVSLISTERGKAVKLSLENGSMKLEAASPDAGSAEDTVDLDYDAEPMSIGYNAKYLANVLSVLGEGKTKIALGDSGSPSLFTNDNERGLLIVLMPIRV